jgi:hypothetical protein
MSKESEASPMNAIRIRKRLDSETLYLPELRPLLGRGVEIIVLEEDGPVSAIRPGTGDWDAADRAIRQLQDYDYDALPEQEACDLRDAGEHLP